MLRRLVQGTNPERSPLRHPSLAHAVVDAFTLSQIGSIIARCTKSEARDGEGWIERNSFRRGRPCFIKPAELCQSGGEPEVHKRKIPVSLDAATEAPYRLLISAKR